MRAAVITPDDAAPVFAAALERKQSRRNVYVSYTEAERRQAWVECRELPNPPVNGPEFAAPKSAGEWWDDRIVERWTVRGWPETPLLVVTAAAAAWDGDDAARAALRAAGNLEPALQWTVFQNLRLWRSHADAARFGVERTVDVLLAEWSRLKLPERDPAVTRKTPRRRRSWETAAAAEAGGEDTR